MTRKRMFRLWRRKMERQELLQWPEDRKAIRRYRLWLRASRRMAPEAFPF